MRADHEMKGGFGINLVIEYRWEASCHQGENIFTACGKTFHGVCGSSVSQRIFMPREAAKNLPLSTDDIRNTLGQIWTIFFIHV